jgi:hypothetical protein
MTEQSNKLCDSSLISVVARRQVPKLRLNVDLRDEQEQSPKNIMNCKI